MTPRSEPVIVRPALSSDADAVGALAQEFHEYLRGLGDATEFKFGAADYLRDGFGDAPAFSGYVADVEGTVVAYALYHTGYEAERSRRVIHVIDLYVRDGFRRLGIGRALVQRLADVGQKMGAEAMIWSVYEPNALALSFCERLGARHILGLRWMALDL